MRCFLWPEEAFGGDWFNFITVSLQIKNQTHLIYFGFLFGRLSLTLFSAVNVFMLILVFGNCFSPKSRRIVTIIPFWTESLCAT